MSNQQPTGQPSPARAVQSQAGGGGTAIPAKRGVCLLVHARDQGPPDKLIESLVRHGAAIVSCTDAHTVLAHACRVNRGQGLGGEREAGSASSPPASTLPASTLPSRAVVVILVEPRSLGDVSLLADLAEALRRYAPRSTLWFFEEGASTQPLRVVTGEDLSRWTAGATGVATVPSPTTPPAARIVTPTGFVAPVRTPMRGGGMGGAGSGFAGLTTTPDRAGAGPPRLRLVEPDESGLRAGQAGAGQSGAGQAGAGQAGAGQNGDQSARNAGADLSGEAMAADGELAHVEGAAAPHLLTAEELSMLLGDPEGFGDEPDIEAPDSPESPESPSTPKPPAGGSPAA